MEADEIELAVPAELAVELDREAPGGEAPPAERRVDPRNRLNALTGEEWLYFTKSVLRTAYPSVYGHDLRRRHGANKPPQLMALLTEFFTRPDERVLDPFAGVGGTLIGAAVARPAPRRAVGIEISEEWAAIYREVVDGHPELAGPEMVVGDCRTVMDGWLADRSREPFDFIATDPPYNIHLRQTMSGTAGAVYAGRHANRRSDYDMRSDAEADLANLPDFDAYLAAMEAVFERCLALLRARRYMVLIVRNAYQDGEYRFTHAELARVAKGVGFVPKGEIVWYQAGSRLRPYGYPYDYVPNISHQFILVLQRPAAP